MRLTEEEYAILIKKREKVVVAPPWLGGIHTRTESKLERRFSQQLADNPDLPPHQRNYFFLPDRDFELDYAFVPQKVYVEVQGMAHRIKAKFKSDIEKRALALLAGWRGLEVGGDEVRSGLALEWLRRLLEGK